MLMLGGGHKRAMTGEVCPGWAKPPGIPAMIPLMTTDAMLTAGSM